MSKEIQVINVDKRDILIFKFNMLLGGEQLELIAENFSKIIGCSVICLDTEVELSTVINLTNDKR